ncbi:hypothetical protein [Paractinoplanes brasiliensis]|uniref:Small secreted protein n=1 Tax=Paractinoplanes brasiliensis TaxID=52695 RepID=A0A4R6JU21_9ACTN|nr:hypothetical protein [Actinoplanes brasiliensis]TDO38145.1 hypothetical protein C8E87_1787 [Actinoplanes brasiliensis]GID33265.1 hypothetical protein Abr02nite_82480 [Actinoplanes brasiliensis]
MHRFSPRTSLAAGVVLAALALTAACSDGASSTSGTTPAAAPAPVDTAAVAAADAALTGDTRQICAQAERTSTSFGKLFADDAKLRKEAASKGAEAKRQAAEKIARDVENFSFALTNMAAITTDTTLKAALTDMSTQVKALEGDVAKLDAAKMAQLTDTLGKACGKG